MVLGPPLRRRRHTIDSARRSLRHERVLIIGGRGDGIGMRRRLAADRTRRRLWMAIGSPCGSTPSGQFYLHGGMRRRGTGTSAPEARGDVAPLALAIGWSSSDGCPDGSERGPDSSQDTHDEVDWQAFAHSRAVSEFGRPSNLHSCIEFCDGRDGHQRCQVIGASCETHRQNEAKLGIASRSNMDSCAHPHR